MFKVIIPTRMLNISALHYTLYNLYFIVIILIPIFISLNLIRGSLAQSNLDVRVSSVGNIIFKAKCNDMSFFPTYPSLGGVGEIIPLPMTVGIVKVPLANLEKIYIKKTGVILNTLKNNVLTTTNNRLAFVHSIFGEDFKQTDIRSLFALSKLLDKSVDNKICLQSTEQYNYYDIPRQYQGLIHHVSLMWYSSLQNSSQLFFFRARIKPIYKNVIFNLNYNYGLNVASRMVSFESIIGIATLTIKGKSHFENIVSPCNGEIVTVSLGNSKSSNYIEIFCSSPPPYVSNNKRDHNNNINRLFYLSKLFGDLEYWILIEGKRIIFVPEKENSEFSNKLDSVMTLSDLDNLVLNNGIHAPDLIYKSEFQTPDISVKVRNHEAIVNSLRLYDYNYDSERRLLGLNFQSDLSKQASSGLPMTFQFRDDESDCPDIDKDHLGRCNWLGDASMGWDVTNEDSSIVPAPYTGKRYQLFGPRPWNMKFTSEDCISILRPSYFSGDLFYVLNPSFFYLFNQRLLYRDGNNLEDLYSKHVMQYMEYQINMFVSPGMFMISDKDKKTCIGVIKVIFKGPLRSRDSIQIPLFAEYNGLIKNVLSIPKVASIRDPLLIFTVDKLEEKLFLKRKELNPLTYKYYTHFSQRFQSDQSSGLDISSGLVNKLLPVATTRFGMMTDLTLHFVSHKTDSQAVLDALIQYPLNDFSSRSYIHSKEVQSTPSIPIRHSIVKTSIPLNIAEVENKAALVKQYTSLKADTKQDIQGKPKGTASTSSQVLVDPNSPQLSVSEGLQNTESTIGLSRRAAQLVIPIPQPRQRLLPLKLIDEVQSLSPLQVNLLHQSG
ncbi:hypothetical protein cand_031230 [Cryptosporidium andersoni]|uniref:Uncharacterized protein n=1 Tax=Cryptosporidium andersoni TaxID=117008 RepID=A0A1J4MCI3_9CRYT|nr:hypothetical protein cand_031230 [Cryptosporidium andersoni]